MDIRTLLADPAAIHLDLIVSESHRIIFIVRAIQEQPCCPKCGQPSTSLHSHYQRTVADLPWHGITVSLQLQTRKLRWSNELCSQKVFCERLPRVVAAYARKTLRLNSALRLLAFALGGEGGARAACGLGLRTSGDTLLRRIRQAHLPQAPMPKVVGVDDWAKRKGQSYGTILVDLEQHRPIDLLPDREANTLDNWLKEHPGIEIITRDRAGAYADGARRGAPQAVQVADRWHLLKNISEVMEKLLHRNYTAVREAFRHSQDAASAVPEPTLMRAADDACATAGGTSAPALLPHRSQLYHAERIKLYELVKEMQRQGLNINQIRLQINRHHSTVTRFFHADSYALTTRPRGSRLAAPFIDYLEQRWSEGWRNARRLFRELKEKGYRGSDVTIGRVTRQWRKPVPMLVKTPPLKRPSPRTLTWLLLKPVEKLKEEERRMVAALLQSSPAIKRGCELIEEFRAMIRGRKVEALTSWLESARQSNLVELENFATGIRRDETAVRAALEYQWSNGQTEGQVNRLKFIKRQMYGRAKFDLLKARVLYAG